MDVMAQSGKLSDIQTAVNQIDSAMETGRVILPMGDFAICDVGETFNTVIIPEGISIIAESERQTILRMTSDVEGDVSNMAVWFNFVGTRDTTKRTRFSGIQLIGYRSIDETSPTLHRAIRMNDCIDFRIDHCRFEHTTGGLSANCRGLIDHCELVNYYGVPTPYETLTIGYGVHVWGNGEFPNIDQILGKNTENTVIVEDCYFERWRHCIVANNGGHIVFRHNTVKKDFGYGTLDVHEKRDVASGRAIEVYNNRFLEPTTEILSAPNNIWFRGGGGVVFDNITDYRRFCFINENPSVQEEIYQPHDIWVWNNTFNNGIEFNVWVYGDIQENRDYFLRKPTQEIDGFTYTPLPYPHIQMEIQPQKPTTNQGVILALVLMLLVLCVMVAGGKD